MRGKLPPKTILVPRLYKPTKRILLQLKRVVSTVMNEKSLSYKFDRFPRDDNDVLEKGSVVWGENVVQGLVLASFTCYLKLICE